MKSIRYAAASSLGGAAAFLAFALGGSAARAQTTATFTLSGTSSTAGAVTLRSDQATTNQATGGQQDQMIVGQNGATGILHGLMEFNLSSIAPSSGQTIQINSASLTLTSYTTNRGTNNSGSSFTISLLNYGYNPDTTAATWNSPAPSDTTAGGSEAGTLLSSVTGGNSTVTWNFASSTAFTNTVATDLNSGDGSLRMLAYITAVGSNTGVEGNTTYQVFERYFSSYSGNSSSVQPTLTVNYSYVSAAAPEPGSIGLLAGAALPAGFAFIGRRRRSRRNAA